MYSIPIISALLVLLYSSVTLCEKPFAQGILSIILNPKTAIVSPTKEIDGTFSEKSLWCQATIDGETLLPIKKAEFVRANKPFVFDAQVDGNNRAYLHFNSTHMHDAGKYKCQIMTEKHGLVWGNLFVYMRPVFFSEGSIKLEQGDADDPYSVVASSVKYSEGDTAILHCPVYAYPQPDIEWYKEGEALDYESKHYKQEREYLTINEINEADEGLYRCKATNKFSHTANDDDIEQYTSVLDIQVKVSDQWGWLIPLFVIIVILLLLFITIYSCAYCNRRRSDQYNVEKKERTLRTAEEQKLREEYDDDE